MRAQTLESGAQTLESGTETMESGLAKAREAEVPDTPLSIIKSIIQFQLNESQDVQEKLHSCILT